MIDDAVPVFINERRVLVPATASVRRAVEAAAPDLSRAIAAGRALVTDGVGRSLDLDAPVTTGAIIRVVLRAHTRATEADAHP